MGGHAGRLVSGTAEVWMEVVDIQKLQGPIGALCSSPETKLYTQEQTHQHGSLRRSHQEKRHSHPGFNFVGQLHPPEPVLDKWIAGSMP